MKCKSCGAQMDPGDRFCRECGMPVNGGKKVNNKEEGYADNILSKSGRFDAVYFVPMAILIGVLFIISSVLRPLCFWIRRPNIIQCRKHLHN